MIKHAHAFGLVCGRGVNLKMIKMIKMIMGIGLYEYYIGIAIR